MSRGLKLRWLEDRRKSCLLRGSLELRRGFQRGETAATSTPRGTAIIKVGRAAAIFAVSCIGLQWGPCCWRARITIAVRLAIKGCFITHDSMILGTIFIRHSWSFPLCSQPSAAYFHLNSSVSLLVSLPITISMLQAVEVTGLVSLIASCFIQAAHIQKHVMTSSHNRLCLWFPMPPSQGCWVSSPTWRFLAPWCPF